MKAMRRAVGASASRERRRLLAPIALVVATVSSSVAAEAQSTPEALGRSLYEAIRSGDRASVVALVHPENRAWLERRQPARLQHAIDALMREDVPESYSITTVTARSVDSYDPATGTFRLGGLELHFPVSPDRFLYLETDDAGGGIRIEGQRAGPVNARWLDEAVARHRGRWYLLLPAIPHGRG